MATLVRQDPEFKREFYRVIEEKARQERADTVDGIRAAHPILGTVLSPLARFMLWNEDLNKDLKGINGETAISRALRRLPAAWYYLNNVVLQSGFQEYAQIDHVAVGPTGVYAVETKNWSGALQGNRDVWRRKQGGGWKKVGSPSTQSKWHADRIHGHLAAYGVEVPVIPVVVFVNADWVRWTDCTGLIFDGAGAMRKALARASGDALADPEQRKRVAELVALGVLAGPSSAAPALGEAEVRLADGQPAERAASAAADPPPVPGGRAATEKQRVYVRQLLTRGGLSFTDERIEQMTAQDAQAVIDKLRFHRDVQLPPLGC